MSDEGPKHDEANSDYDEQFALTMKRARIDWEPTPSPRVRMARGTGSADFDEAITLELPPMARKTAWIAGAPVAPSEDAPVAPSVDASFALDDDATALTHRARSDMWFYALVAILVLLSAIGLWWVARSESWSPAPAEMPVPVTAPAVVELPAIVVDLSSPEPGELSAVNSD
jgi:hypothetical protein